MVNTDVLIVGGGPAGLAAAIAIRQKGFHVTVVDAARPPIDKPCGEGLMPDGVEALKKLGVTLGRCNSAPFRGIRFIDGAVIARANFPAGCGLGVRRTTLHALLLERAAEAGVEMHWNTHYREWNPGAAHWIVAADGMNSRVRQWAGFGDCPPAQRRFGFRRHFPVAPWTDTVDVHWGRECQVYITPVAAAEVCVAVISRHRQLRLDRALQSFPAVYEALSAFLPTTPERGAVTECRRIRNVCRGNVALVGDASGGVDALTGEGLALCFKQALALAEALAAGNLQSYAAAHRRIARTPEIMARLLLLLDRRTLPRRLAIRALASQSAAFLKASVDSHRRRASSGAGHAMRAIILNFARAAALLCAFTALQAAETVVEFDPSQTHVEFTLSDVLHTVHGAFKLAKGVIRFDPATGDAGGALIIDAASGASGSNARDSRMKKNVLEAQKYPEIIFTPHRVKGSLALEGESQVEVEGTFTLHGANHPLTLAAKVNATNGRITATTRFVVPYVQWGLKDPSNFILRVSNKVDIEIHAAGTLIAGKS